MSATFTGRTIARPPVAPDDGDRIHPVLSRRPRKARGVTGRARFVERRIHATLFERPEGGVCDPAPGAAPGRGIRDERDLHAPENRTPPSTSQPGRGFDGAGAPSNDRTAAPSNTGLTS